MKTKPHSRQSGFTLIEIIAVLVLAGILTSLAGRGMVEALDTFVTVSQTTTLSQDVEYALSRMSLELMDATAVAVAEPDLVTFFTLKADHGLPRTLAVRNNCVLLNNSLLIDQVASHEASKPFFSYFKFDNTCWTPGKDPFRSLARIDILLRKKTSAAKGRHLVFPVRIPIRENAALAVAAGL